MSGILTETFIVGLLATSVAAMTPLLFAGLAESVSQRAGVINVGIEGYMLMGAFFGYLVSHYTGSVWVATLGGLIAGALLALVAAYTMITRYADQIVTGLGMLILAIGITGTAYRSIFSEGASFQPERVPVDSFSEWPVPGLSEIPWIGEILFEQVPLVYIGYLAVPAAIWLLRSEWGLMIRAAGENPEALESTGANAIRIRYLVVLATGAMSGLGGVFLSIGQTTTFSEGLVGGRGFIALGVAIVGRRNPIGVLIAAFVFAIADSLQLWLPTVGVDIPQQLLAMLPYIVTLIALAGVLGKVRHPAAFLKPYVRQG